jgi:hypothetical protein
VRARFQPTKKPNLISGDNSQPPCRRFSAKAGCHSSCRDKIEFQFAVPKIGENQLFSSCDYGSPVSCGVNKVAVEKRPSTAKSVFFESFDFFAGRGANADKIAEWGALLFGARRDARATLKTLAVQLALMDSTWLTTASA